MDVSHDVVEDTGMDSDGDIPRSWKPKLGYEYEVEGRIHGGSHLALGGKGFGRRKGAQAWLNERPVGSSIPVYVNPADPADSIPNIRSRRGWWVPALFIALAIEVEAGLFGS